VSKNTSSEKAYSYRRGAPPAAFSRGLKKEVAAMGNNITVVNPQSKELEVLVGLVRSKVSELRHDLDAGVMGAIDDVHKLGDWALELGRQLGNSESLVQSNQWLQQISALIKGDSSGVTSGQMRVRAILTLRAASSWLHEHNTPILPFSLKVQTGRPA
jgi:hypothetical protein